MTALETLQTFNEHNLPDLDTVVRGALEFFRNAELMPLRFSEVKRPLVVGSGNAAVAGEVIFRDIDAVFANESTYEHAFDTHGDIDAIIIISASGGKHAIGIAHDAAGKGVSAFLITNNPEAPAAEHLEASNIVVLPKVREPYTYNTSTYMGMLLAQSKEDPAAIAKFIEQRVVPLIPDTFSSFDAFFLIVPPEFDAMRSMFSTKFDELFGPKVLGRIFTHEEAKHAKTVVPSDSEYFISFGEKDTLFGNPKARLHIPLSHEAGPAAMMAITYFVIGNIQKQLPPYFKENIVRYTKEASSIFGQTITPIVE